MGLNSGRHHSFSGQSPHFGLPTGPPRQHRIGLSMGSDIIIELVERIIMKNLHEHCSKPWVVPLYCLANRDSDGDLDWFRKKRHVFVSMTHYDHRPLQGFEHPSIKWIEDPWGHYPQRGNMNLENPTCLGMILMIYINIDPREWESDGIWTKSRLVGWNTHPENMTCKLLCIILLATRNCYNCIQLFWHIRMHVVAL